MKTVKTWTLSKWSLDEADYAWISSNSDNLKVEYDTQWQVNENGYDWDNPIQVTSEILITTTCKKQESMLHLKYGNQLRLYRVYNYADL